MGKPATNGQAHEWLDTARLSAREQREMSKLIEADDARWAGMARDQYSDTTHRAVRDVDQVIRICEEGEEAVESIVEDLESGVIDATEAARLLSAARRDLKDLRKQAANAEKSEAAAWESVNTSPAEYQAALMRRAPGLFKNGRNLLSLPTDE